MRCTKHAFLGLSNFLLLFLLSLPKANGATVKDIFTSNTPLSARVPRDNKYYSGRYGSNESPLNRAVKPEDSPEARETAQTPVEKRCTRCDSTYSDTRYPYESRTRYDDRRYRDRYDFDDRRYDDRRYDDRRYDDRRYDDRKYDRYDDRYERRPSYDRYDRDRYDRDRYNDRDRYDRDRDNRDRYYDRDYERGFGYDNRGYDYRDRGYSDYDSFGGWGGGRGSYSGGGGRPDPGSGYWGTGGGYASSWNYGGGRDDYRDRERYDYDGFKPWDETYKGSSGWDSHGRGYYFATGIPGVGAGHWGTEGYADNSKYGGGGYRDRYAGYRPRDPYDGYRSTSYLYARPSSTTTNRPSSPGDSDPGVTQNPQQESSSG